MYGIPASSVRLAAVASIALQSLLLNGLRHATLLGVSDHAAWAAIDDEVLTLSDREAVRLPNAVELDVPGIGRWIADGETVAIGRGTVAIGTFAAVVRRWFDPTPALPRCDKDVVAGQLEGLSMETGVPPHDGLLEALRDRNPDGFMQHALALMGSGTGLTPEGDDVLAGTLAAAVLLGRATETPVVAVEEARPRLVAATRTRTTSFSAALIRHALAGRVSRPFADVLLAVTGRGCLQPAAGNLLAVGSTSGRALAAGMLTGGLGVTQEPAS